MREPGGRRCQNPPEDKVPILKPKTDEVLASASRSHLLPEKHRVTKAWKAEVPDSCGPHLPLSHCTGHHEARNPRTLIWTLRLTTPCHSRRPLAVLVRTSSSMVSGTSGRLLGAGEVGEGTEVPDSCSLPGLAASPNTHLTSWRRLGLGGLGSRHRGNRLRTAQGHLWASGGCETATHLHGAPTPMGSPDCHLHPSLSY